MSSNMLCDNFEELAPEIIDISTRAGRRILEFYGQFGQVGYKADGSRVTAADYAASNLIIDALERIEPSLPALSEESQPMPAYAERKLWDRYWLIDPLDGTSGFIAESGEFTVNIALIKHSRPVLGAIHIPVTGDTYWAAQGIGAFVIRAGTGESRPISVRKAFDDCAKILGNRSRGKQNRDRFTEALSNAGFYSSVEVMSSSRKFCRVAEGSADIYVAFGGTSEWDTAAGQCIVECAGGRVLDMSGDEDLRYNKKELGNPWFYVSGIDFAWRDYF